MGEGRAAEGLVAELGALLQAAGQRARIERVSVRSSPYRSTHDLEEVTLHLSDGRARELVLKAYGAEGGSANTGPRPRFLVDPYRELWAYETLLEPLRLGAPRFYGALRSHGSPGGRLVLERVDGTPLSEVGDLTAWTATAAWLAEMHRKAERVVARPYPGGRLLQQDAALHRRWLRRAKRHATSRGRRRDLAILESLGPAFERAVEALAASPSTLLHGEFYPSNVLAARGAAGWSVRPADWETIGLGPPALDLAALVAGDWDAPRRSAIVRTYLEAGGRSSGSEAGFDRLLGCARLVTAVQWLGWAADWSPPAEHAHDWLDEAARAAERIGA